MGHRRGILRFHNSPIFGIGFGFSILRLSRLLTAVLCISPLLAAPPVVQILEDATHIEVSSALPSTGTDEGAFLRVALLDEMTGQPGAPVFGTYRRDDARLFFRPRFALAPGARYQISAGGEHVDHLVAASATAAATVERISPSVAELPANLLKFYLFFSRPMREGREVFEHIQLLDDAGEPIPAPWRDTELWTEDARRLTLWIHPGRVKQGVNLREELGPVLRPGAAYTLVVDAGLRDASGQPLGREFRYRFHAIPESRALLDLAAWSVKPPAAATREPLHVRAAAPLDGPIARRSLHVRDAAGREMEGVAALAEDGRSWSFTPARPWSAGPHTFLADPWVEDLAGNNFARIFDDDITAPAPATAPETQRDFTPLDRESD